MTFTARGWVSVAELIVFIPSALAAALICRKHGFSRSSGWIYTLILTIIRIIGAICQLASYSNPSTGLLTAYVIIDSIGLSPLLLATLGMLSRLVDNINAGSSQGRITVNHFRLLQLLITLGLILSIAGGASSSSSNGAPEPSSTSKAGICLYIVAFVGLVSTLLFSLGHLRAVPRLERRVALAVLVACPFILIRLIYSVLAVFAHSGGDFNVVDGSVPILVGMAVVEEFIVVGIYVFLGFHVDDVDGGPIASRPWKQPKDRKRTARRGGGAPADGEDQGITPVPAVYTSPGAYRGGQEP